MYYRYLLLSRMRCNHNIFQPSFVYKGKMARFYNVRESMGQGGIFWFVDRKTHGEIYALDELFTEQEATLLQMLLQSRDRDCRIEEVPPALDPEQRASWNLIGSLIELEQGDVDKLGFRAVGCLES